MSVELAADCVTRNVPFAGVAVSAPSAKFAIETVAVSLSVMLTVAVRFDGTELSEMSGSRMVKPSSVTITVSVPSTIASLSTATLMSAVVSPALIVTEPASVV